MEQAIFSARTWQGMCGGSLHIVAFAMRYGVPASDLYSTVYAYPTFMSDVKNLV